MREYAVYDLDEFGYMDFLLVTKDKKEVSDYANGCASTYYRDNSRSAFAVATLNLDGYDGEEIPDYKLEELVWDFNVRSSCDCVKYYQITITEKEYNGYKWLDQFYLFADKTLNMDSFCKWYMARHPEFELRVKNDNTCYGYRHDGELTHGVVVRAVPTWISGTINSSVKDRTRDFIGFVEYQM